MKHFTKQTVGIICIAILSMAATHAVADQNAGTTGANGSPYYYIYNGQPVYLDIDRGLAAVKIDSRAAASQRSAALSDASFGLGETEEIAVRDWFQVDASLAGDDVASVSARLNQIASDPAVEFVSPVFEQPGGGWMAITPDILVRLKPEARPTGKVDLQSLMPAAAIVEENFGQMDGAFRLKSSSANGLDVLAQANELASNPLVEWAEPDMMATARYDLTPNDPGWTDLWGLNNDASNPGTTDMDMDCDLAFDVSTGDENVLVLILDDGTDMFHPDLHLAGGADFTGQGTAGNPGNECDNHGTAVAGCVSAIVNNGIGTVGAAPGCRVLAAKYTNSNVPCDGSGTYQFSWLVNALSWGEAQGARVSNNSNSLGTSSSVTTKYNSTYANGMVHFASAGNDASYAVGYPASLASVNAISAINRYGNLASFSNYHPNVTLTAPGQSIYTTDRQGAFGYSSIGFTWVDGTSFSSPYASAIAALLISVDPWLTAAEVEAQLYATATDLGPAGRDDDFGYGLVNGYEAIQHAAFNVDADVFIGPAPLTVNFTASTGRPVTSWDWTFGDGNTSTDQNPSNDYNDPGLFSVETIVHTAETDFVKSSPDMIWVYADTLDVLDGRFNGQHGSVDVYVRNYLPVSRIEIPITWAGSLSATFDSISVAGHRSEHMGGSRESIVPAWSAATAAIGTDGGPLLPPGAGTVGTLHFTLVGSPPSGTLPVVVWDYSIYSLEFTAAAGEYEPVRSEGEIIIGCCQGIVGDANSDGGYEPTIGDISTMVDLLFLTRTPLDCYSEADVNLSGGLNPTADDITIGDISTVIDYLYINYTPLPECL